jgi:disulfide bond formation protein DsbB
VLTQAISRREGVAPGQAKSLWLVTATLLGITALSVAAVAGGMEYLILVLAVCLAYLVYRNPKEALSAGILFLLACNVLLPSSARFDWSWRDSEAWQMYYWATGLLIISLAAVARIGIRSLQHVPASVKAFLLVAIVAALVGFANGNAPSYVLRQLYGSVLLVAYFAIAYHIGDEEFFLRRLRTFGLVCAAIFFVYYGAVFSEYGFHREITTLGTLEGAVAILCFAKGLTEKRLGWMVSGIVLFAVPLLIFVRRSLITFGVGAVLALFMRTSSRRARFFYLALAVLGILPGVLTSGAEFVLEKMQSIPVIEAALPEGARDVNSLAERALQLASAAVTLQRSPVLGAGFGAEITWQRVAEPTEVAQYAYIDNGWAYLAVKMGGLGIITFVWFLVTVLRCVSRNSLGISVCLLSMVLVMMFSEPVFLNFNTSPLLGAMAGLLCARKARERAPEKLGAAQVALA